jgi:membrane associated rhomboid family serine protease
MLSDRSYMREEYQRERTSALTWLVSALAAGFILQFVMGSAWSRGGNRFEELLGLSTGGLRHGMVWTLVTHAFLHSTSFIVHGIFNILAVYFLGRELMPMLGSRRFFGLIGAATIVGGLAWAALHWQMPGEMHLGATAAVDALVIVFACFFPQQEIPFLLFFLFPVTVRPKQVALALAGFALVVFFCYELPHHALPLDVTIASSAHLGGMLTGYLYYRFVHDGRWFTSQDSVEIELPRWLQRARKLPRAPGGSPVTPPAAPRPEDLRVEIDRILDKINSDGFGALTPAERRVLDEAKAHLSGRE